MCIWGATVRLGLVGAHPNAGTVVDVDSCLVPLVTALNAAGLWTRASCCGHGKRPGTVMLQDGREIHIFPDFETGRRVDALFPYPINDRRGAGVDRRQNVVAALAATDDKLRHAREHAAACRDSAIAWEREAARKDAEREEAVRALKQELTNTQAADVAREALARLREAR